MVLFPFFKYFFNFPFFKSRVYILLLFSGELMNAILK